jgi:hypothetical protein
VRSPDAVAGIRQNRCVSLRELVRRCLVAAVAGALVALTPLALTPQVVGRLCEGPGCWILSFYLVPILFFGLALLAWALMALGRVRPAWPVALAGPVVMLALSTTVLDLSSFAVFSAVVAACYAFAALVTSDALPQVWQVALGAPVVVLFVWGVGSHLLPA